MNYLTNAVKFTEKGTIVLRVVKVEESEASLTVRFEVEDTGIGISNESLTRLFNIFEQADNTTTRKYGGTGLGLSITKHLAELMGGSAGCSSTLGTGSIFWFTACLKKEDNRRENALRCLSGDTSPEVEIQRHYFGSRILVVDDDPLNREVATIQLEFVGLIVDLAGDGKAALAAAKEMSYAMILMDAQMPNMNGLDATRKIRMLPDYVKTPILAMTANVFVEDRQKCLEAGMNDFLFKPFDPETLFKTVLKWLEKSEL
jgi:CheY-like chemotaxis protein